MTTIVRDLAILLVQNIRSRHNRWTRFDRRVALSKIEDYINGTDMEILLAVKEAFDEVNRRGSFGIRGRTGSYFLQATGEFIKQIEYLLAHAETTSQPHSSEQAIKLLAKQVANELPKTLPTYSGHQELLSFVLETKHSNDPETVKRLIQSAQNYVAHSAPPRFAFWRRDFWRRDGFIRNALQSFVTQATYLFQRSQVDEEPAEFNTQTPANPIHARDLVIKKFQIVNKKWVKLDIKRKRIENKMYELLKHFYPNSHITNAWHLRMTKVANGEIDVENRVFFSNHNGQIQAQYWLARTRDAYYKLTNKKAYCRFLREKRVVMQEAHDQLLHKPIKNTFSKQKVKIETNAEGSPEEESPQVVSSPPEVDPKLEAFDNSNPEFLANMRTVVQLKNEIYAIIQPLFPNTRLLNAWHYHCNKPMANGEELLIFFKNYEKEFLHKQHELTEDNLKLAQQRQLQPNSTIEDHFNHNIQTLQSLEDLNDKVKRLIGIVSNVDYQRKSAERNGIITTPSPPSNNRTFPIERNNAAMVQNFRKNFLSPNPATFFAEKRSIEEQECRLRLAALAKFDSEHPLELEKSKRLSTLEEEIHQLLLVRKESKGSRAPSAWNNLVLKIEEDQQDLGEIMFFANYNDFICPSSAGTNSPAALELASPETMKLNKKIADFKEIIQDQSYLQFRRERKKLANSSEYEIKREFSHYMP